jgi:hypothetical protein
LLSDLEAESLLSLGGGGDGLLRGVSIKPVLVLDAIVVAREELQRKEKLN